MSKSVKAKFRCDSVTKSVQGKDESGKTLFNERVQLQPVYGKDGSANAQWSKWTPSGSFEMTISNQGAQGIFEPGKQYAINIVEAEEND